MRKALFIVAGVAIVGLTAVVGGMYLTQDHTVPEIAVSDSASKLYSASLTKPELLVGVTADDAKDGDVSDSLMIEKVSLNSSGTEASITYVAVDRSGNVAKLTETYPCGDPQTVTEGTTDAGQDAQTEGTDADAESAETTEAPTPTVAPDPEAAAVAETEAAIQALPEGSPQFHITQHYLTLAVGEAFVQLSYVGEITDAKDSRDSLYERIQIDGSVDTSVPGTYDLSYYVTDSDGLQSNVEVLHVTVQ